MEGANAVLDVSAGALGRTTEFSKSGPAKMAGVFGTSVHVQMVGQMRVEKCPAGVGTAQAYGLAVSQNVAFQIDFRMERFCRLKGQRMKSGGMNCRESSVRAEIAGRRDIGFSQ